MTRHQRQFRPLIPAPPLLAMQLSAGLAGEACSQSASGRRDRFRAIACVLSASEGWRDASARLGGAFAGTAADNPWSNPDEEQ